MHRNRILMAALISLALAMVSPGVALADISVYKGTGINLYNPDLQDVWVVSDHETPAGVGSPFEGEFEYHPATQYPCNRATNSGVYTNIAEYTAYTGTVLERRYVNSGTVQGTNTAIVGSSVEYVILAGPPEAVGVSIRRLDWEVNGLTGSTFTCLRLTPNLGTPFFPDTYFRGHAEGDIHGVLCLVGNDGMGHGVTETRKTSTEGIQDTSVSTTVWDNPVISVVESEVVHTNVLIYAGAGTQFEYSRSNECIDDGDYLIQHTSEGFVLPAFNVGHSRNKWVGIGVSDYGVSFGYIYNRTETTDVVPRVIGLSLVGAYDLIVANGFAWGSVTTTFSEVYPAGRVISQSVTAGALADLGSAIDLVVSDGPAPEPCECDLNADGRCDMRDWLAFGQRWGATNCSSVPCACDLNADGRCDMRDWLLFGTDWGRTDCPLP